jgi:hypothetical protein
VVDAPFQFSDKSNQISYYALSPQGILYFTSKLFNDKMLVTFDTNSWVPLETDSFVSDCEGLALSADGLTL